MSAGDDQEWLDGLGGTGQERRTAAHMEGSLLRSALHSRTGTKSLGSAGGQSPSAAIDPLREQLLIDRAREAGVLAPASPRRGWRGANPLLLAAAAGIAGLAIGVNWPRWRADAPSTTRTATDQIIRLDSRDPARLKQKILSALHQAGVRATGYESLGVQGIDAELPLPVPPNVREALEAVDIPVPANGQLQIQIRETR